MIFSVILIHIKTSLSSQFITNVKGQCYL